MGATVSVLRRELGAYFNTPIGYVIIAFFLLLTCWFYVDDGTGRIYVDLNPGGIAIPQRVGKAVTVIGKVAKEEDMLMVNATGVAF